MKELKGPSRPLNNQVDRKRFLEALEIVDDVIIFDTAGALRDLVRKFEIDFMVVGEEYRDKEVIGSENAKYGALYYEVDERSSTGIIEKIKNL